MAEVFFLGTGGVLATRERGNTSFLLRHGGLCALIDCPGSVLQKIARAGVRAPDVAAAEAEAEIRAGFSGRLVMPADLGGCVIS